MHLESTMKPENILDEWFCRLLNLQEVQRKGLMSDITYHYEDHSIEAIGKSVKMRDQGYMGVGVELRVFGLQDSSCIK